MGLAVNTRAYDLLLSEQLSEEEIDQVLAPVGFADWRAAARSLVRLAKEPQARLPFADLVGHLLGAMSSAASPDRVLASLERFVQSVTAPRALFDYLADNPRTIEMLVTLFAGSQFLTEILLRNPEYLEQLASYKSLAQPKSTDQFYLEARAVVASFQTDVDRFDALRRFQRPELLRIGVCDLLHFRTFQCGSI